mmetsp:Transcript_47771/g.80215  ORF Transcript_47771/g.80215 Transcript_47771/m.80215 type:complete len:101 (-) Transcript_47771:315-617(-)
MHDGINIHSSQTLNQKTCRITAVCTQHIHNAVFDAYIDGTATIIMSYCVILLKGAGKGISEGCPAHPCRSLLSQTLPTASVSPRGNLSLSMHCIINHCAA